MKERLLLQLLDAHTGSLATGLAVLLYLTLLAGPSGLGAIYGPIVGLLFVVLLGLGVRALQVRARLRTRLRIDAPLLLLGGLLLLALALRLWRISQTTPAPGTGEAYFVEAALDIIRTGNYVPTSLRYPSLLVYLELATSVLRFISGASSNLWTWPTQLAPEHLYSWGRGTIALLGTATLALVYGLGARRYGRRAGLLAALFLALLPMHLTASGTIAPEVPAALLALLTAWSSLNLFRERTPRWALAAGACAGLAFATHYAAALAFIVPLLATLLRPVTPKVADPTTNVKRPPCNQESPDGIEATRWQLALLSCVASLLAFVAACPAALFKLDRLVAGLVEVKRAYFPAAGSAGTGLHYLLTEGVGIGPALLVLLGIALLLPRLRRQDALLFIFPLATYLALLIPRTRFPSDMVLLAPWLALLAAAGVERLCTWLERKWSERPLIQRWLPWGIALISTILFLPALW